MNDTIVIFKNEKIGDLIHSYNAINKIIIKNPNNKILIYLSHYNYEMNFLFNHKNVKFRRINENMNIKDKINIFLFLIKSKIKKIYIFKPSYFLFLLPFIFSLKKTKFYGICINNNNYKRPSEFYRKFLFRYVINDRGSNKIRMSIHDLHINLVDNTNIQNHNFGVIEKSKINKKKNDKYLFIHFNKNKFNTLGWNTDKLFTIIDKLKPFFKNIVITNDINDTETNQILLKNYPKENNMIYYYPNIKGKEFFDLIGHANYVIAFHGMITAIAAIQNTKVIDLFNCNIKSKNDYYKSKNAFHEFVPKKKDYEFLIPKKNVNITLNKIIKLISNGRKINS